MGDGGVIQSFGKIPSRAMTSCTHWPGPRPVDASIPTYYGMVTGTEYIQHKLP
jgi:hypothetical protein